MKAKHTPGPWKLAKPFDGGGQTLCPHCKGVVEENRMGHVQVIGNAGTWGVATLHFMPAWRQVQEANARLIALAPELADVIMECAEFARGGAPIYPGSELANSILTIAAKLDQ